MSRGPRQQPTDQVPIWTDTPDTPEETQRRADILRLKREYSIDRRKV